jgi:hypothetical protein
MRNPREIAGFLVLLTLAGCSKPASKATEKPRLQAQIGEKQPAKQAEQQQGTGEMDRIEDALAPWPAGLAFYEKRPLNPDSRHRMAVSLTGERLPFLIRFDLAEDGQTIKRVICTGITSDEACGALAHYLSTAIADAVIGGRPLREAIYATIMQEEPPKPVPGWEMTLTKPGTNYQFMLRRVTK